MKRIISFILIAAAAMCLFSACQGKSNTVDGAVKATIKVKDFGDITLELYPDKAPVTVNNFVDLAESGFYDGLTFHRIYSGFMIQGGDPDGNGNGGSGKTIKGEFSANGVENDISHVRGVISMARSKSFDSASSQFFICHADSTFLDGQYAAFGKVIEGMDVVDAIASVEVKYNPSENANTTPVNPPVIETVIIDRGGSGTASSADTTGAA